MNKAIGIISEFNIFHNGHKYLFDKLKEAYPDKPIVCVMSGNFVQRGEPAIIEKYKRAECAVKSGTDLVIELPYPFSSLSAEAFAKSGVDLLYKTGLCDSIAFGTENDNIIEDSIKLNGKEYKTKLKEYCTEHKNEGYALARQKAYESLYGKNDELFMSNSILASEYIGYILNNRIKLDIIPVKRYKCGYNDDKPNENFASASYLRGLISENKINELRSFVPESTMEIIENEAKIGRCPAKIDRLYDLISYLLVTKNAADLSDIYGFSQIAGRAQKQCDSSLNYYDFINNIKNSKFTDSRIKRSLLALLFGVKKGTENSDVPFSMVLAANKNGRELLADIDNNSSIPIFTKPKHAMDNENNSNLIKLSFDADKIYTMCFSENTEKDYFIKKKPYIE